MSLRTLSKTRHVRVDEEFYSGLRKLSMQSGKSIVDITRELKRDLWLFQPANFDFFGSRRKKGFVLDIVTISVFLFSLIIVAIIGTTILFNMMNNQGLSTMMNNTAAGNSTQTAVKSIYDTGLDSSLVAGYFLLHIGMLMAGALIGANALFIGINIVLAIVVMIISVLFSTVIPEFIIYSNFATQLPKTLWLVQNGAILEFLWIVLLFIVMYIARNRGEG